MNDQVERALDYANENKARWVEQLIEFVRIPSISTDPQAKEEIHHAAEWVSEQLKDIGIENVQVMPTDGHPVVYGEWLKAGADKPTVLVYGHYDVQPPEPLELWDSPPFEPTERNGNLYGRGASDMKGQVIASLKAVEALQNSGGIPVNVKFLIEGEEEIGSPSLDAFIDGNRDVLEADFALNPDTGMLGEDLPTVTYGLRGLAYFEVRLTGPQRDLHSGLYGGAIHNPAQVLCELIAGMHDEKGRVALPGFYDSVRPLDEEERAELGRLPVREDDLRRQTGAPALWGEPGYVPAERIGARPTLEVNGLLSGFTGEGSKTVLPSKAMAKISMRLVPDQTPDEVQRQLVQYIRENAPETVTWEVIKMASGAPSITNRDFPAVQALKHALEAVWGKKPLFTRSGGSVPVVGQMQEILGLESVLTGFGLPDDNLHAPNEKIHLPTFYRGIETLIRFFSNLSELSAQEGE